MWNLLSILVSILIQDSVKERKENPNYYCIITADVRYDNELSSSEKLFYGEITALSSKEGECWASNSYFSNLYGVRPNTISNWVTKLKDKGYISVRYEMNGKETKRRIIRIVGGHSIVKGVVNKSEKGSQLNEGGSQSIVIGYSLNDDYNSINSNTMNSSSMNVSNINANSTEVGCSKDFIENKILDILMDYNIDTENKRFINALENYKEVGGFTEISKIMNWDSSQQNNWKRVLSRVECLI